MSARRKVGLVGFVAVIGIAGCGGSSTGDDASTTAETTAADVTAAPDVGTADTSTTSTLPAPTTTGVQAEPHELADFDNIAQITITTPSSGNGEHPLLAWEPVDGAVDWVLSLTLADGQPYWAWNGPENEIWLGGSAEQPAADSSGPYLYEPMTLHLVGYGADGAILAASQPFDIAP